MHLWRIVQKGGRLGRARINSSDDVWSQTLETRLSIQGQILIWLTFNYWTTWRSTTRWTRTYEGLRGARLFHLVSLSLQISLIDLPGSCLGLCVCFACLVVFGGLVVGFFFWGNLISITGSFQLLTDHVSHLSGNAGKKTTALHWPFPSNPINSGTMASYIPHLWPFICPVFADGGRINGHCSRFSRSLLLSLSSSTSETGGGLLSSSQRVPHCGLLCSSAFPSISPPVSPLLDGMVGTVAGDGAPRSLSVVRSSRVCWTRLFSFSDSSLAGLRPFSLLMFHPAHALGVLFVALCCLLRYWLRFYLNWQLMTTVSLSLTFRQIHLVHNNNICSKPLFTKFNRLSIFVANSQILICLTLSICSIFQPMNTALPSPSDSWHACSRRCHLALDLTVRETGYTHPSLHSPGDCIAVGVFCVFVLVNVCCLQGNRFPLNLRLFT